jgi:cytochrome P450
VLDLFFLGVMGHDCTNVPLLPDIMGDLVFGRSFGTMGAKPENRDAIRLLGRAARRNYTVGAMPFLHRSGLERWLPPFRGLFLDRLQYLAFGKRQVVERSQDTSLENSGRKDIFHYLLDAKDPETGEGMPRSDLWMEANTLIVAGSDTSSTTLSATLYYILHNPSCLQQLTTEIRSTFSRKEEIRTGTKLQSAHYLRACIDESMRMSPAVPGLLPRLVLPGGLSIPVMNLHIPVGVDVGTCTYALQHHEDYVVEPFKYDPSRWLQQQQQQACSESRGVSHHARQRSDSGVALSAKNATTMESHNGYAAAASPQHRDREALSSVFAPFSMGNRACLGRPLVYMEISIAVARLVFEYEMRLVETAPGDAGVRADVGSGKRRVGEYHLRDWFLGKGEGPLVEFARREKE